MAARPHENPTLQNAVEYVVAVMFMVAGGIGRRTVERRAERIAERLANDARAAGVVNVSAVVAPSSTGGNLLASCRAFVSAANIGHATYRDPEKLDPDLECALTPLEAVNEELRARQGTEPYRRRAVGCHNASRVGLPGDRSACECIYCRPDDHLAAREQAARGSHSLTPPACLCATATPAGGPSRHHGNVELVLERDPEALKRLAQGTCRGDWR